jgi:hypothetical protein
MKTERHLRLARILGWELRMVEETVMHFPGGMIPIQVPRWFRKGSDPLSIQGIPTDDLPDYFVDQRCFGEIWNFLSNNQKRELYLKIPLKYPKMIHETLLDMLANDYTKFVELVFSIIDTESY